ncbi:hypothetical protein V8F20_010260 [Naviculisporaceae sp. PSN 640]
MELQPKDKENQQTPRTSPPINSTTNITEPRPPLASQTTVSSSVPVLRFPKPQGSRRLANWISSSSPDILQLPIMSDMGSMADSAYEIISLPGTDNSNSDHGHENEQEASLTESTGSLEPSRPEDVHSLDGTEGHYDTEPDSDEGEDEESDASSRASSIRYADQALQNPSSLLPANNHIIEFVEVKQQNSTSGHTQGQHTIRDFSEEETEALAKEFGMVNAPRRMNASIVLDMADGGLSLEEPLKILYVGPSEPKRDIILKLGNAIWTSPANGTGDEAAFGRHREGVYNLVPISSFGPTPELDLMEASHYQIKVDHCTSISRKANTGPSDARPEPQYSLTFGHDAHYDISVSPFATNPQWSRPHVAIFFVAEDDSDEDRGTRNLAVEFVSQLGTPSIFISDSHSFNKPAGAWVGGALTAGPHISLNSCDPQVAMTPIRLPIDFASFTNIDPVQLNRNLAHLTGLIEPVRKCPVTATGDNDGKLEGKEDEFSAHLRKLGLNRWQFLALAAPIPLSILFIFAHLLMGFVFSSQPAALSEVAGIPLTTPVVTVTSTSLKAHTSTTTVVVNVTSTKTVGVGKTQASTSTLASALSFAGFLSDKPSVTPAEPVAKSTVCSAHIHGPKEILVKVPLLAKERLWSKGALEINVWRHGVPLQVQLSSVDEGILVNLGQNEAHGQFNVSVVTTRKYKINETLLVDFGKPTYAEAVSAGFQALYDLAKVVEDTCAPAAAKLRGEATSIRDQIVEAGKAAQGCYEESIGLVKRSLVPDDMVKLFQNTKDQLSRHIKNAQELRQGVDNAVVQAQVASKLWWLKLQGKAEEHDEYQRKATEFLKSKLSKKGEEDSHKESTCNGFFGKRLCPQKSKATAVKESRWKRKIMG